MHQPRPRLSANIRRKILAALVVASGTGTLAADAPRDSAQTPTSGSTSDSSTGSTLELRLTRRSWLKPTTGDSSATSGHDKSVEHSADAAGVSSTGEPTGRWRAAGTAQPKSGQPQSKPGQPSSPELAGSPQSPKQPTKAAQAPLADTDSDAGGAADSGWVARDSIKGDALPEADRQSEPTERPADLDRALDIPVSLGASDSDSAENSTDTARPKGSAFRTGARPTEQPEPRSAPPLPSAAEPLQPAESAAEVQERLEKVMVRRLRVGRDGSLLSQSRGEPSEHSSRDMSSADAAPPPAADKGLRQDSSRAGDRVRIDQRAGSPESVETQIELQPESAPELDYTGRPAEPIELTAEVRRMRASMRRCLQHYFDHPEQAPQRSNWGMLHAIMVYGVDTPILAGRQSYSAIAWMAGNNICRGKRLLREGPSGIEAATGIGLQGHQAQALAIFALVGVPADYPLYAGRGKYSVEDLVRAEAQACRSGEELTFSLIGLSHYLDTDAVWTGADGERWDFQRLIREELAQPIVGSTCGGTHRLMGFAHALRERRLEGRPIEGQWLRAEKYLEDFVDYTYRLQNRDGSMSTNWFEGREDNGDLDRKVQTTGHMVEFLLTVTPDSQLQNPKLVRSVRFLLSAMNNRRDHDWSIGPKGHALRSLALYYQRVYDEDTPWRARPATASRPSRRR